MGGDGENDGTETQQKPSRRRRRTLTDCEDVIQGDEETDDDKEAQEKPSPRRRQRRVTISEDSALNPRFRDYACNKESYDNGRPRTPGRRRRRTLTMCEGGSNDSLNNISFTSSMTSVFGEDDTIDDGGDCANFKGR